MLREIRLMAKWLMPYSLEIQLFGFSARRCPSISRNVAGESVGILKRSALFSGFVCSTMWHGLIQDLRRQEWPTSISSGTFPWTTLK